MTMAQFIKDNREELKKAIWRVCPGIRLDNAEIRLWVLNDEGLYLWARNSGVKC